MILSNILANVWPGNWDQFISGFVSGLAATIIGTVIGIFGPFYLQSRHENRNKKRKAIQYLLDLKNELEGLKKQFNAIKAPKLYLSPIKTPVWDSLINTNEIQLLSMLDSDKTLIAIEKLQEISNVIKNMPSESERNKVTQIILKAVSERRARKELKKILTTEKDNKLDQIHGIAGFIKFTKKKMDSIPNDLKKLFSITDNLMKHLFQIYDLINEYNLWWNMYAQGAVVGARKQKDLSSIIEFTDMSKEKLLCENTDDKKYQGSIKYTLDLIEKIEILNSDKAKGDA